MDLRQVELAADILFRMCREHPEICPHNYEWMGRRTLENGVKETRYVCTLCDNEKMAYE